MKSLFTIDDAESFSIEKIWDLYRNYVNPYQVDLISKFGFGKDTVEYAEGLYIFTKTKKIYDFTGGIGVLNLGHNHPKILKIRKEFSKKKKMEVHKNYFSPYVAALSSNIANLLPEDLNISYFQNSGTEAVEGAVKIAYKYHGGNREIIMHSDISFHGKTIASSNLTGSCETSYFSFPKVLNKDQFIFNNIHSVKQKILNHKKNNHSNIFAIIIEPFNASSLKACSKDFLLELRKICSKEDIVLIFDEIYSGWYKTGKLFYFMNFEELIPDIITSSKSLGGGKSSISAYTCKNKIFNKAYGNLRDAILHSTTFNGFGEETATAIEAINIMLNENYQEKSESIGQYLNDRLLFLKNKYPDLIDEILGKGCLQGLTLKDTLLEKIVNPFRKLIPIGFFKDKRSLKKIAVSSIIFHLYNNYNILTFYGSNYNVPLKVAPSLIVTKKEIDYFVSSLDKLLEKGISRLILAFIKKSIIK